MTNLMRCLAIGAVLTIGCSIREILGLMSKMTYPKACDNELFSVRYKGDASDPCCQKLWLLSQ